MRIKDLKEAIAFLESKGATCSPRDAASVLGGQPYYYNIAARNGKLDLDYFWSGRSLRIYTASIIKRIKGGITDDQVGNRSKRCKRVNSANL